MDDLLPFAFFVLPLHNKKKCFLLIDNSQKMEIRLFNDKAMKKVI